MILKKLIYGLFLISINAFSQPQISIDNVSFHIEYLASDSMRGRYPGTHEDEEAAKYIANQFKASGLKLLADNGYQHFDITTDLFYEKNNTLSIKKINVELFFDYIPAAFSANDSLTSQVVFVGYGIDDEYSGSTWNDYENISAKNKLLIIIEGSPRSSATNLDVNISIYDKIEIAKKKECAGILFVSGKEQNPIDKLPPIYILPGTHQEKIPIVYITRNIADKLLRKNKETIEHLEKKINTENKAHSFETMSNLSLVTNIRYIKKSTHNVVGLLESTDSIMKKEYIVVGAHYDHLGIGGILSGSRMPDTIAVHNGADDNASGVAGIIELAKFLNQIKDTLRRSIVFIAFSGEEEGLIGSKYFITNPLIPKENIKSMLNFDMIGRFDEENKSFVLGGAKTAVEYEFLLKGIMTNTPINVQLIPEGTAPSDHVYFYLDKIPVLFFHTGLHNDYHTPFDDASKINYAGIEKILDFASEIIINLSRTEKIRCSTY